MNTVDQFSIDLKFDLKGLAKSAEATLKSVNSTMQKVSDNVRFASNSIEKSLTNLAGGGAFRSILSNLTVMMTDLDNLAYVTHSSVSSLYAWGEAVKRNGGSAEGFYSSVNALAHKVMEMQTAFGSEGQAAFIRLGMNLRDTNGHVKDTVTLLTEMSEKFSHLTQAQQFQVGKQLGLDAQTIRTIAEGRTQLDGLVARMKQLGASNLLNNEETKKFRNSTYDLQLVFNSLKIQLGNTLMPVLISFMSYINKGITYLRDHTQMVKLLALALSATLLPSVLSLISLAFKPFYLLIAGILLIGDDFLTWLHGGKSAFGGLYTAIFGSRKEAQHFLDVIKQHKVEIFKWLAGIYLAIKAIKILAKAYSFLKGVGKFLGLGGEAATAEATTGAEVVGAGVGGAALLGGVGLAVAPTTLGKDEDALQDAQLKYLKNSKETNKNIVLTEAFKQGFNANTALTIAQVESGLDNTAHAKGSTAKGLFQLINSTARKNGVANSFDAQQNAAGGIANLKKTAQALGTDEAWKIYIGEFLGTGAAKRVLSSAANVPLSSLISKQQLNANKSLQGLTVGQFEKQAQDRVSRAAKHINVKTGDIHVQSNSANPAQVAKAIPSAIAQHVNLVATADTGRIL